MRFPAKSVVSIILASIIFSGIATQCIAQTVHCWSEKDDPDCTNNGGISVSVKSFFLKDGKETNIICGTFHCGRGGQTGLSKCDNACP